MTRLIRGRVASLSGGRVVFLGKFVGSDQWGLAFRNEDGEDKYLSLSADAAEALFEIVEDRGNRLKWHEDFPHKKMWELVENEKLKEIP